MMKDHFRGERRRDGALGEESLADHDIRQTGEGVRIWMF